MEELIENALKGQSETAEQPLRRVMIVDDDHIFRKSLSDMLAAHDYSTLSVSSAEEALKELQYDDIDVVVSDIKMPGMDGVALTKEVKQRKPDLPVVLITGLLSTSEAELQADGFLRKPFRVENIMRLLESLIPQATSTSK
jgi:two-component system C4-dicarboxylate transport response regulator DctD